MRFNLLKTFLYNFIEDVSHKVISTFFSIPVFY
jgi:hypothetical protein